MTSQDKLEKLKGDLLEKIGKNPHRETGTIQSDLRVLDEIVEQAGKQISKGLDATSINRFVDALVRFIDRISQTILRLPPEERSRLPKISQRTKEGILHFVQLAENSAIDIKTKIDMPRLLWIKGRLEDSNIVGGSEITWGEEMNASRDIDNLIRELQDFGLGNADRGQLVRVIFRIKDDLVDIREHQITEERNSLPVNKLRSGQAKRILQLCEQIQNRAFVVGLGDTTAFENLGFINRVLKNGDIEIEDTQTIPEESPSGEKKVIAQLERIISLATKERVAALTTELVLQLHKNLQYVIDTLIAAQSQQGSVGISSDTAKNLVALCGWIDKRAIDLESKDAKLDLTAVRTTMNKISNRYIGKEIHVIGDIRKELPQEVSALTRSLRRIDIQKIPQMDANEFRRISELFNGLISDLLKYQELQGGAPISADIALLLQRVCTALADRATTLATSEKIDTSNQRGFFMTVLSILGTRIKIETNSAPANEAGLRNPSERLLALLGKNKPEAVSGYYEDQIEALAQEISKIVNEFTQQDIQMTNGVRFDLLELLDALDEVCTGAMVSEVQRRRMESVRASIRKNKNSLVDGTVKMKRDNTAPSRVASTPSQSAGRALPEWLK